MLTIRDLAGNEEALTDFKGFSLNRKINGEKVISLTVLPTKNNVHAFPMVEEESIITYNNEEYVIKKLNERGIGNTYLKQVDAIHKFYVDMINKQKAEIHNGSITFNNFLDFVFNGTGYTYSVIDSFYAESFENLGNDNRLALLQKGLERYKAEIEIIGKDVRFKKRIGNDTDFQFRYGHNIKTIERNVDTTNLATVINGTGAEGITAYYRSPNADIFGEIDAHPVEDERFTSEESLLEEMKARLEDTPEFSITIDFADLRAAGYPYTVPNEGDRVYVIYEPMNDLLIETRIMEIDEELDHDLNPIKTNVTLANFKKTFAGTVFDNVQKQLRKIVNDDGVIKYNVLDEAVKVATEALKSAQTELEFNNGIIAREKDDPNRLVLLNSSGLGISKNGGSTFSEAITADGFVLSVGAVGRLSANNIQIGAATEYETGYDPTKTLDVWKYPNTTLIDGGNIFTNTIDVNALKAGTIDANKIKIHGGSTTEFIQFSSNELLNRGKYTRTWKGVTSIIDSQVQLKNGYLRFSDIDKNAHLGFSSNGISTYLNGDGEGVASGTIEFFSQRYGLPGQVGITITSNYGALAMETSGEWGGDIIFAPRDGYFVEARGALKVQREIRSIEDRLTFITGESPTHYNMGIAYDSLSAKHPYLSPTYDDTGYLGLSNAYLRGAYINNITYQTLTQKSSSAYKSNIVAQDKNTMNDLIKMLKVYSFNYETTDTYSSLQKHFGFLAEESPEEILSIEKDSVVIGNILAIAVGAIQHLQERISLLEGV